MGFAEGWLYWMMEKEKRVNPILNVLREEWRHLGSMKKTFVFYLFLFVIAETIFLMNPLIIGLVFNTIQEEITSDAELNKLIGLIFLLLAVTVGSQVFHSVGRYFERKTGYLVYRNYVNKKVAKVLELPVKWHKDHHSGDTIDKINRGSGSISSFSQHFTFDIVYGILGMFGPIVILFFIDLNSAIFVLIYSLIVLYTMTRVDRKLNSLYSGMNNINNKTSASIFDYVSNIITVVTLRLKKTVSKEIDRKIMLNHPLNKKVAFLDEIKWGSATVSISVMTVLVLSYRAYNDFNSSGVIMIGTLYILYGYLQRIGQTFYKFAEIWGQTMYFSAGIENAKPIDEEFEKIKGEASVKLPKDWREVEIKNLEFTYNEKGKEKHLERIDFKLRKGKKIALVGESGSGKSTMLALLRGLYDPDRGEVCVDGKKVDRGFARLKHDITLIPQDPEIFNNTIRYNITMDLSAKKEEIDKVIEMAQFRKVVERLDKGLETNVLEKGVSLSGGEKQRLALARGLLAARNSDIILLDEPTSSVDSLNEMKIHDSIFKEFKGKTIVSSIHRLHLLDKFDYIYLFDKGKIIAEGSLQEIKNKPRFRYLWRKYGLGSRGLGRKA
jgi:ATP-binding cassette, subfamily B, bacterial